MCKRVVATILVLITASPAWSQTIGTVIRPVLVQSGPGSIPPFYPTASLEPGQTVTVLAEEGDFYAIRPPEGSFSYVPCKAIRQVPGETSVGVVQESVSTFIGSQMEAKCSTQGVRLAPGTLVRILGQERIIAGQEELAVYRIEPVGEKRYVPRSAIALSQPLVHQGNSSSQPRTVTGIHLAELRQQAEQAYRRGCETGDFREAKRLYEALNEVGDASMRWEAMNRLEFIRLREREWASRNNRPDIQHVQPAAFQSPSPGLTLPARPTHTDKPGSTASSGAKNDQMDAPYRVCGILRRSAYFEHGQPLYYLEDHLGRLRCYVSGQDSAKWQALIHRSVEVYGTRPVYRGDLRAEIVTARDIRPLP